MKVFLKGKFFSIKEDAEVFDENENPIYKIKGKLFSLTKKKFMYNNDGELLFIIRNKYFRLFTRKAFVMDKNKNKIAVVKDKFLSINHRFYVEGYKDEISVEGDLMSLTMDIIANGKVIGKVTNKLLSLVDNRMIETENEKDMSFIVALLVAIYNIKSAKEDN